MIWHWTASKLNTVNWLHLYLVTLYTCLSGLYYVLNVFCIVLSSLLVFISDKGVSVLLKWNSVDDISSFINFHQDMRPLKAGRCQYYSSGSSYIYESFYTVVSKNYKQVITIWITIKAAWLKLISAINQKNKSLCF